MRDSYRFVIFAILALVAVVASACGGSSSSPTSPSPTQVSTPQSTPTGPTGPTPTGPITPTTTITAISVNGRGVDLYTTPFKTGDEVQGEAIAAYTDGTKKDVTSEVRWVSTDEFSASVSSTGIIKGLRPGDTQIRAQIGSVMGWKDIRVVSSGSTTPVPTTGPATIGIRLVEPGDGATLKRGDFAATKVSIAYSRGSQVFDQTLWVWACLGSVDKPGYFISTTCQAVTTGEIDRDPGVPGRYINPAIGYRPGDEGISTTTKVVVYLVNGSAPLHELCPCGPYKPEQGWPIVAKAEKSVTFNWR